MTLYVRGAADQDEKGESGDKVAEPRTACGWICIWTRNNPSMLLAKDVCPSDFLSVKDGRKNIGSFLKTSDERSF